MPWKRNLFMKTVHSSPPKISAAANRPSNAHDRETPRPLRADDAEGNALLAEDELGNLPLAPEIVSPRLARLETWDAPAQESGYRVAPQAAEDEAEFPEVFAEEGADEAEEELRAVQGEKEQLLERDEEEVEEEESAK